MAQTCGGTEFSPNVISAEAGRESPPGKFLSYQLKMFNYLPLLKKNLTGTLAIKKFFYHYYLWSIYSGIDSSGTFFIPRFISGIMPIFI